MVCTEPFPDKLCDLNTGNLRLFTRVSITWARIAKQLSSLVTNPICVVPLLYSFLTFSTLMLVLRNAFPSHYDNFPRPQRQLAGHNHLLDVYSPHR
ncbi:hypothetical protein E2C01_057365 [Portunus trituberculatus]|uniref:Uncharacterized protein n=1 Tax=Portunus trituberculatus TaxID=210409 RepID=A0A5B7H049_PORTR|nr:hypothetical protein [Portunus trituberculatus]